MVESPAWFTFPDDSERALATFIKALSSSKVKIIATTDVSFHSSLIADPLWCLHHTGNPEGGGGVYFHLHNVFPSLAENTTRASDHAELGASRLARASGTRPRRTSRRTPPGSASDDDAARATGASSEGGDTNGQGTSSQHPSSSQRNKDASTGEGLGGDEEGREEEYRASQQGSQGLGDKDRALVYQAYFKEGVSLLLFDSIGTNPRVSLLRKYIFTPSSKRVNRYAATASRRWYRFLRGKAIEELFQYVLGLGLVPQSSEGTDASPVLFHWTAEK